MDVLWHPYPETRPPAEGWYLVTKESSSSDRIEVRTRFYDADMRCFYYDRMGDRRIKAWTELPEPFVGRKDTAEGRR